MPLYYYSFEFKNYYGGSTGAKIVTLDSNFATTKMDLHETKTKASPSFTLDKSTSSGWTCALCYPTYEFLLSFDVSGLNENKNDVIYRFQNGFAVKHQPFLHIENNRDIPPYLDENRYRFRFLLNRRNEWAGFMDIRREQVDQKHQYTCESLGGKPREASEKAAKIIDYVMYNGERDALEARLNVLKDVVDLVVVAETAKTFTEGEKELLFPPLKSDPLISKFLDKIVYVVSPSDPAWNSKTDAWTREHYYRSQGLIEALKVVPNTTFDGAMVLINDVDEISRPTFLSKVKTCKSLPPVLRIAIGHYYYSFQYRRINDHDLTKLITNFDTAKPMTASDARANSGHHVPDAGWHCAWCFKTLPPLISKVKAYAHTEHNHPEFLTKKNILNAYRWGFDMFGRGHDKFIHIEDNADVPLWVLENQDRFGYWLDRRNEWSGFVDVKEELDTKGFIDLSVTYAQSTK
ncbi:UNVERIFIED_CONTAM: hypothetical protein HDU68_000390 [Siphonaria sp. JEL0065]|nr:hypothetical protein HDU68_000390 [Siphonaria sp. JEL0065]